MDGIRANERLAISTSGILDAREGTISMWVKSPIAGQQFYIQGTDSALNKRLHIRANETTGNLNVWAVMGADTSGGNRIVMTREEWHFIALTWNLNSFALYIDDKPPVITARSGTQTEFDDTLYIGGYGGSIIDDLRIDKIARTDTEISGWYSSGAPLMPDEHTTALFPFDGNLYNGGGVWVSATKDVSSAVDTASGKLAYTATIPGTSYSP